MSDSASSYKYKGGRISKQLDDTWMFTIVVGGKRKRYRAANKADIELIGAQRGTAKKKLVRAGFTLKEEQMSSAKKGIDLLSDNGCNVSLLDACEFYVKHHKVMTSDETFKGLYELYEAEYQKRLTSEDETVRLRPATYKDLVARMKPWVEEFGDRSPESITIDEIKAVRDDPTRGKQGKGWGITSKKNYVKRLSFFYQWLKDKGYCSVDPASGIKSKSVRKTRRYSIDEVRSILTKAQEVRPEMVPYFALASFAGIRPEEMSSQPVKVGDTTFKPNVLTWENIDLKRGEITIPHTVSKTGEMVDTIEDKTIAMPENLVKWLVPYKAEGDVFPFSHSSLARWRREVYNKAKVKSRQDGLRHSCGAFTYFHEGLEVAVDRLRHESPAMLMKTYKGETASLTAKKRKAEGAEYFSIVPVSEKVIQLKRKTA